MDDTSSSLPDHRSEWLDGFARREYRRAGPREAWLAKRFSCRLGRHSWTTRVDHGEGYEVCSACGKTRRGVGDDPSSAADDLARRVRAKDFVARTMDADRFRDDS